MIGTLIAFKHRFPGLWSLVEGMNGSLFRLRYRKMDVLAKAVLEKADAAGCRFSLLEEERLPELERFLTGQEEGNLTWFQPHGFDRTTLERLFRNPAFLMMQVTAPDGSMVGYFFLRGFFIGRAFAGLLVDKAWQNRGIGTAIWAACAEICQLSSLRMQATISTDNKPSMASCSKGTDFRQIQVLDNGYMAIECKQKRQDD